MRKRLAATVVAVLGMSAAAAIAAPGDAAPDPTLGKGKVVALDEFYNHQVDKTGKAYHYIWSDTKNSGFSKFGNLWKEAGATITSIDHAPTAEDLNKTSIYIIVNPSIPENAAGGKPNYIEEPAISTIETWVKNGGVLVLLANDPGKCEFTHFNDLASKFGMTFDGNLRNSAPKATDRPHAAFSNEKDHFPDNPLFKGLNMIYMKEISSIAVKPPAEAVFVVDKDPKESVKTEDGAGAEKDVIIASAKVGKGFVLAVGDPWVYNEYIDATWPPKLPVQNHQAAVNMIEWLLPQSSVPMAK